MASGLTEGAGDETKARYAFVYGDFRRVHRSGRSLASTEPPNGVTRRLSWQRTTFSSFSMPPADESAPGERNAIPGPAGPTDRYAATRTP